MKPEKRLERDFEQFVRLLPKLEPAEFCGIMKILGTAGLCRDENEEANLENIMNAAFDKFLTMRTKQRKELLKVMQAARKKG